MSEYTVKVARNYKENEPPNTEEFPVQAKCREEALRTALTMVGKNDRILSVVNSKNSTDRLDQVPDWLNKFISKNKL